MFIDTHAHLFSVEFVHDVDEVIQRAYDNGVHKFVLPNIDSGSIKRLNDLSEAYPHICYPTMGLHPTSVADDYQKELEAVEYWLEKKDYFAIGEIGLDLYWSKQYIKEQRDAFRYQIKIAKQKKLPIVVHVRNSFDEVLEVVAEEQDGSLTGIFHCFSGSLEEAQKAIDLNFFLGIGGVVTFKNSNLDQTLQSLKLDNLVLETDSPYLAPVPFRGKRNESAYMINVAEKVAEIFEASLEEVARVTTQNAQKIFSI